MKIFFKILIISLVFSGCTSTNDVEIVVTKKENLDKYVGKLITIKGELTNTKIPTIIGVDVNYNKKIDEGNMATATGILVKTVVTDANPYAANRGNGTFYRLQNKRKVYYTAIAKIVK